MKVKIVGNVAVFEAGIPYADLALLARFKPEALVEKDKDGNETFRIIAGTKCGVSAVGVVFEPAGEKAVASVAGGTAEEIADRYGCAIAALNRLEYGFSEALAQVAAERATVLASIETV